MKKLIFCVSFLSLLFGLGSCKKETARNYDLLNKKAETLAFVKLDSAKTAAIYNAVASERTIFLNQLEQDYPGLKDQMDNDIQVILSTNDSSTRLALIEDFDQSYYQQVHTAWNNAGIDLSTLENKYRLILGNVPFSVGEFGTLTLSQTDEQNNQLPSFPDDSIAQFVQWQLNWHDDACGGINGNNIHHDYFGCIVNLRSSLAGGCSINTYHNRSINMPSHIYQYYAFTGRFNHTWLSADAFAVIGGGSASTSLKWNVEFNGDVLNSRDLASVCAIAPIIWHTHVEITIPSTTEYIISARQPDGFPTGVTTIKSTVNNQTVTGGIITGSFSDSYMSLSRSKITLTK